MCAPGALGDSDARRDWCGHWGSPVAAAHPTAGPDDPILTTRDGNARDRHNLRQRVVAPVIARAERLLAERGGQPLPNGITPHKLRHTFASVLFAIGKDPTYVMNQLGHTDPAFTLRVYAHVMRRSPEERAKLRTHVKISAGIETAVPRRQPPPAMLAVPPVRLRLRATPAIHGPAPSTHHLF